MLHGAITIMHMRAPLNTHMDMRATMQLAMRKDMGTTLAWPGRAAGRPRGAYITAVVCDVQVSVGSLCGGTVQLSGMQ